MKMYDDERVRVNGQPAYCSPAVVLPTLQMTPKSHGLTIVSAMLCTGGFTFSWFRNYADTSMIPNLLSRYYNNPEEFLENFFDYKIPGKNSSKIEELQSQKTTSEFKLTPSFQKKQSKPVSKSVFSVADL